MRTSTTYAPGLKIMQPKRLQQVLSACRRHNAHGQNGPCSMDVVDEIACSKRSVPNSSHKVMHSPSTLD